MSLKRFRVPIRATLSIALATAAIALPVTGRAATYVVGVGTGCTHATLQGAVATAAATPGAHVIRLTRSVSHAQIAQTITTGQTLDIAGGFATCAQATADTTATIVDGGGGATDPVLRINTSTGAIVRLDRLTIRNGDEDGTGYGGGIYSRGDGVLEIQRSSIMSNLAGYGGGIYAEGTGSSAVLKIGSDVYIGSNTARYSGGGVYLENVKMEMVSPRSMLALNKALGVGTAGGYGGGLMMLSGSQRTEARIDTTGQGNFGAIYGNEARYGGGIAMVAKDGDDENMGITVAGTDAQTPVGIRGNFASIAGGGLYARADEDFFGGIAFISAHLRNFALVENSAADGAAAYVDAESYGVDLYLNSINTGACPVGRACGQVSLNDAHDGTQATNGAIVRLVDGARLFINQRYLTQLVDSGVLMQGNRGGRLIYASNNGGALVLDNVVASGNEMTQELIRSAADDDEYFRLRGVTIAGNAIGAGNVITTFDDAVIDGSIIWQPGKTSLQANGGTALVRSVIASETASLGGAPEALLRDPRFTDPANGDYTLRAASPAIDVALIDADVGKDVIGRTRAADVTWAANGAGPRDVGAYEVQFMPALVLNANFDVDLHLWTPVFAGVTTRDPGVNVVGESGSGSAKVSQVNVAYGQAIRGVQQCVHLPAPGTYTINGWGRGTGTALTAGDIAQLQWEFRSAGGEVCTQGAATRTGFQTLSNSNSWSRPANPAFVVVTPQEWTTNSSIAITLVGIEGSVSGNPRTTSTWFDGISLQLGGSDTLYRNGFDP